MEVVAVEDECLTSYYVVVLHSNRFPMKGTLFTRERKQYDTQAIEFEVTLAAHTGSANGCHRMPGPVL